MLALKVIAAGLILVSLGARFSMDFFWKDGRTKANRWARNSFMVTALIGAVMNMVVIGIEEKRKIVTAEKERAERIEFENNALGGISPEIWLFFYQDGKLICPRANKDFPGKSWDMQMVSQMGIGGEPCFCLLIRNPNSFPIYDIEISLLDETPNLDNSHSLSQDFHGPKRIPILHANANCMTIYSAPPDLMSKAVKFSVRTKRGNTDHNVGMIRVGNEWEYASSTIDYTHHKIVSSHLSDHFPLDTNGNPTIPIYTRVIISNPPSASGPVAR